MADEEYVQLSSWEELIAFIERAYRETLEPEWNPKPKRKSKKAKPQEEGLF